MKVYESLKVEHVNIKKKMDDLNLCLNKFRKEKSETCCKNKNESKVSGDYKKNFVESKTICSSNISCHFCGKFGDKIDTCYKKRSFDKGVKMIWVKKDKFTLHKGE